MDITKDWNDSHDTVLKELAEEAQVNGYLHRKAYEYFERRNLCYQLPVIILSVFSGSANFISANFPTIQKHIVIGVGGLSILTSIISSVSQYLKLAESAEAHRIACYAWEKLFSRLNIHLHLKREDRDEPLPFINGVQVEYLRLKEMSPDVPPKICHEAKVRNRKTIGNINSPVIVSGFRPVHPYGSETDALKIPFPIDMSPRMSIVSPPSTPSHSSRC